MSAEVLHSSVVDTIGREITTGTLAPGAVLTLSAIGSRFGVSRTVAREAMRLLESLQLVTSRRRIGLVVRATDEWDVFDPRIIGWRLTGPGRAAQLASLTELRTAIEPVAAAAAARRAKPHESERIVELAGLMHAFADTGRLEDFCAIDIEFHAALLRASHNEMFAALTDVVTAVLAGCVHLGRVATATQPESLAAHDDVARAIRAADAVAAETAMSTLMELVHAELAA